MDVVVFSLFSNILYNKIVIFSLINVATFTLSKKYGKLVLQNVILLKIPISKTICFYRKGDESK